MDKSPKKDKKADSKEDKQKKIEQKYEKSYNKKVEEFKSTKIDALSLLNILLDNPPFKSQNLELKQDTFLMVIKTFAKVKPTQLEELVSNLGEDKSVDLLKYCYKSFELVHKGEEKVIQDVNFQLMLNYLNTTSEIFGSIGIARTGFERGDLYE